MDSSSISTPNRMSGKKSKRKTSTPISSVRNVSTFDSSLSSPFRSSLISIDERLASILHKLLTASKTWESEILSSTSLLTRLELHMVQCCQGSSTSNELQTNAHSFSTSPDKLTLMESSAKFVGLSDTADRLTKGRHLEERFDEFAMSLELIEKCVAQVKHSVDQLSSLYELHKGWQLQPVGSSPIEGSANSSGDIDHFLPISNVFLWPAVLAEAKGLLNRLQTDVQTRQNLFSMLNSQAVSGQRAVELLLIWRHLSDVVRWSSLLDLIEHLMEARRTTE